LPLRCTTWIFSSPRASHAIEDVLQALEVATAMHDVDLLFASRQELADDFRPDEAGATRDQDRPVLHFVIRSGLISAA